MRPVLVLAALLTAVVVAAHRLREPGELALVLDEDTFEEYLDGWLEQEQSRLPQTKPSPDGCTFKINGDLGQPQPVYFRNGPRNGLYRYLAANGNTGQIHLKKGEGVVVACPGQVAVDAVVKCVKKNLVSSKGWIGYKPFKKLTCPANLRPEIRETTERCFNGHTVIFVGFSVKLVFHRLYGACFDKNLMQVLYVWYAQTPEHAIHQTRVSRPSTWQPATFYPGIDLNDLYTQASQKSALKKYLGSDTYITKKNQRYLAKGHLAAKSDFVFASAQRATFYYINAAPQWQCINAGNWNRLEQYLRARIGVAGYSTVIYTGTYGILKLPKKNQLVDIFLSEGKVPVPLFFYKVVYEKSKRKGTAFVTINNPYLPLPEAEALARTICVDQCRGNHHFDWLRWQPDRTEIGYSFCCTVNDFRKSIPHLPNFDTVGLLF